MGRTIDESIRDLVYLKGCGIFPFNYGTDVKQLTIATDECIAVAVDTMRKYQMFQDKYTERLKADMVAMLTEIQLEIEEKAIRKQGVDSGFEYDYEFIQSEEVVEIIQQKINALKAESEE